MKGRAGAALVMVVAVGVVGTGANSRAAAHAGGVRRAVAPVDGLDAPGVSAWPLTPEGSDSYWVTTSATNVDAVTVSAPPWNTGGNSRIVFRRPEAGKLDGRICATWRTQTAPVNQEGAALRAHHINGLVKAITITKNVWLGAAFVFNVHVWDPRQSVYGQVIAQFNLSDVFWPAHLIPALPWRMCAQVVGDVVSVKVWPLTSATPAWGDPAYGGSVRLPPGWDRAGGFGMYAGHLRPGDSATYDTIRYRSLVRPPAGRDGGVQPDRPRPPQPVPSLP